MAVKREKREEMTHFMACLKQYPNDNFRDYVLLSLFTRARQGNIASMRWDDLGQAVSTSA